MLHKARIIGHIKMAHFGPGSKQPRIVDHFLPAKKRKLNSSQKENITIESTEFLAKNILPINFFEKPATKEYLGFITKSLDKNADPELFCPSSFKINTVLAQQEVEIRNLVKDNVAKLVGKSSLYVIADDWTCNTGSYERENEYRSLLLQVKDSDGDGQNYMAGFEIAAGKKHVNMSQDIKNVLDQYGLKSAFEDGLIPIACDGGMVNAASKMTGGNSALTCGAHTVSRISHRMFDDGMKAEGIPGFKDSFQEMVF